MPLLNDTQAKWDGVAITTYHRNNHAVRTKDWRHIRYANGIEELYDRRQDPHEWNNLAGDSQYTDTIRKLQQHLPSANIEDYGKRHVKSSK